MKYFITRPQNEWKIENTKNNDVVEKLITDKTKYPQYLVFETPKAAKKKLKKLLHDPLAIETYELAIHKLYNTVQSHGA